jgi:hypothetical protein
MVAKET